MHTAHILLVEAESHEEAIDKVRSQVTHSETPYPSWSDWHEIGGRWENLFGSGKNCLRYTENEKLAEEKIKEWVDGRINEMKRCLEEVKDFDLAEKLDAYDPEAPLDYKEMKTYYLYKLAKNLQDSWTPESGVYDLEHGTPNLKAFRERLAIAPEMQYLVVVDFHF